VAVVWIERAVDTESVQLTWTDAFDSSAPNAGSSVDQSYPRFLGLVFGIEQTELYSLSMVGIEGKARAAWNKVRSKRWLCSVHAVDRRSDLGVRTVGCDCMSH
jgi:hypothetical protein